MRRTFRRKPQTLVIQGAERTLDAAAAVAKRGWHRRSGRMAHTATGMEEA